MTEQIKIDFEETIKTSTFSESDTQLKKSFLNKFIEKGFPSRKFENWKFSDINQIIKKNIGELSFYSDYSSSNKIDTSTFVDGLEHNKVIFINGRVEKIDFAYEDKDMPWSQQPCKVVFCLSPHKLVLLRTIPMQLFLHQIR